MTEAGKRLLYDEFGDGLTSDTTDGTIVSRPGVVWEHYDRMAAAIVAIEAEATAAAEQRLRERIEALPGFTPGTRVAENGAVESGLSPSPFGDAADWLQRGVVLSLLDTPPPASPRQGEPVDVERLARALRTMGQPDLIENAQWGYDALATSIAAAYNNDPDGAL